MNHRGFSAIEVTLGIVIMSITALAFAPMLTQAVASYSLAATRARAVHDIRHAMFQMTREILYIGNNEILGASPTQLQFVDQSSANTDFRLQNGRVMRGATLLVPNVTGLTFIYRDSNGNPTTVLNAIRRIGITLSVSAPVQGTVTLRSEVFPRGFVYNNFQ